MLNVSTTAAASNNGAKGRGGGVYILWREGRIIGDRIIYYGHVTVTVYILWQANHTRCAISSSNTPSGTITCEHEQLQRMLGCRRGLGLGLGWYTCNRWVKSHHICYIVWWYLVSGYANI